jgi:hypothetical protein
MSKIIHGESGIAMEAPGPSLRELVEFRERYGLQAYLIWCIGTVEMPRWVLMGFMRIARHFGELAEDRYERSALSELIRVPLSHQALTKVIQHSAAGNYVSLEFVREIAKEDKEATRP